MQYELFSKINAIRKHWPEDADSNDDLLANLAGKAIGDALLSHFGSLTRIAQASFDELRRFPGIGNAKASAIKSAFMLAARLSKEIGPEPPLLDTPDKVFMLLREENRLYRVEVFQVALLNTRRRLMSVHTLSQGTLDTILVHPREVFALAVQKRAACMVLAHNHPSGDPTPSEADIRVTRDLIRAGQILKIEVLDHLIIGLPTTERPRGYVSLKELGYWPAGG
jgi:DNA repair protein RadC